MSIERSGVLIGAKLAAIVGLLLIFAAPQSTPAQRAPQVGTGPLACADKSIVASAVRTPEDVQAFVQCAYEYVQEMGFEEARRAFHEDERWRSGPIYVFVDEVTPMSDMSRAFVFPPDPSREGEPWGLLIDIFGNDWYREQHRIVTRVGEGWIYYSFTNPATGRDEPKASYLKSIDWDGTLATIGAGVYRRDLPGTCRSEEVNALLLEDDPSNERLKEFVRCAALELESKGVFCHPCSIHRSALGEQLGLLVRTGYLRQRTVQRRSLYHAVWYFGVES